jgi:hypothetical protein
MVIRNQGSDTDTNSEGNERRRDDSACARPGIDHGGVILRHIDHLWTGGLNRIDGLASGLLDVDLLLCIAAQRSRGICLGAQTLDGSGYLCLVGRHGFPDGRVVVYVLRHHLEDGGEGDERDEGGIEALLLGAICERRAAEVRVLREPVIDVQDLLRVGGGRRDLGEKRVGIKCDGRE